MGCEMIRGAGFGAGIVCALVTWAGSACVRDLPSIMNAPAPTARRTIPAAIAIGNLLFFFVSRLSPNTNGAGSLSGVCTGFAASPALGVTLGVSTYGAMLTLA